MTASKLLGLSDQIRCVEREIKTRERIYPRLAETGRMNERFAVTEIALMRAVLESLVEYQKIVSPELFRAKERQERQPTGD